MLMHVLRRRPSWISDRHKKTSFSMGNQDIRAYLNGLYFEVNKDNIIVVATDGHQLTIF
jgi:DNA polymerase-3 subunit beta